jgi:6-phosphogluconolactonase (cycloisomerase 2 family)
MNHGITARCAGIVRSAGTTYLLAGMLLAATTATRAQQSAVFTSTNATSESSVLMLRRAKTGALTPVSAYFTGGTGTGAPLGSQGAIALSPNGKWLFVVNAGSSDISVFQVAAGGLKLVDRVPSGGTQPVSLTVWGNRLYVLNAGSPNNITGFTVANNGNLTAIPASTQPLSAASTGPAEVAFSPYGDLLVVTEKTTNLIDVYAVDASSGAATAPVTTASVGETPYGFAFDPLGRIFVSEAAKATVTSYFVSSYGILPVTGSAPDFQTAPCWMAIGKNGKYAWAINAHSSNVSAYGINPNGTIGLLTANMGLVATPGPAPTDVAQDNAKDFLYILESGSGAIAEYAASANGTLTAIGTTPAFGSGFVGLAAW